MGQKPKIKKNHLPLVVASLVLFLALIQLFISHRLATTGELVRECEVKAAQIDQENQSLQEEISQMGSLSLLAQKATALGFSKISQVVYLTSQIPVAMGP